jgi:hypothetical protein
MKDVARLKKRFQEQLGFLASSAAAYDQGSKAEAIRLAGVMRVLFSHSRKSAGLVFQLGGKRILLNSTCPKFPIEPIQFSGIVDFVFKEGQTEGEAIAPLDGSITPEGKYLTCAEVAFFPTPEAPQSEVPHKLTQLRVHQWLREPIFIFSPKEKLTRQDLLEKAANQDGAAHVDPKLDPDYEQLHRPGGLGLSFSWSQDGQEMTVKDVHLPALRQMAYELLTSPELQALAAP